MQGENKEKKDNKNNIDNNEINKHQISIKPEKVKKKDEFKIIHYDEISNEEDDFEKLFEKDIEENCSFNIYVDKLEINEIPDDKLILQEKEEILNHKNYQIQKLKAYIASLEKEKEDLIMNFRNTTNVLLEKIKQSECNEMGFRPQTAKIVEEFYDKNLNNNKNNIKKYHEVNFNSNSNTNTNTNFNNKNFNKKNIDIFSFEENKEYSYSLPMDRCANCKQEFPKEMIVLHSLDCLRNKFPCKFCKELIHDKNIQNHLNEWKSKEVIYILKKLFYLESYRGYKD
jgi:hypothetical protein